MLQVGLDRLGDWNPQLFREIKGRLTIRNLLLAIAISVGGQLIFLMYHWGQLPSALESSHKYCTGPDRDYAVSCLTDAFGHLLINWRLWSLDAFISLSAIAMVLLPVIGTYLLVSDLDREERRGTLNFLRLTPQSASSLFVGKMLGVPILLYGAALLTVPLHLWLGHAAGISLSLILGLYGAILASCVCFYSAAFLFGLISTGLGGFQPWLGSGALLFFLSISINRGIEHSPLDLLTLLTPTLVLAQTLPVELLSKANWYRESFATLEWLGLPISTNGFNAVSFTLLNYGLWTFWAWQGIQRRFRNPNISLWSKRQSYGLTVCFEALILGLALGTPKAISQIPAVAPVGEELQAYHYLLDTLFQHFNTLMMLNLVFFLGLMGALLPHRQVVQDWARYRRDRAASRSRFWSKALIAELLSSEKSPAILAIAVNLGIAASMLLLWVLAWPPAEARNQAIAGLVLGFSMLALYAVLAQLLLLLRTSQRGVWAFGAVSAAVVLPILVFAILSIEPNKAAGLWLFSAFPYAAIREAAAHEIVLSWLGQLGMVSLLGLSLTRQVRQIGESASKTLLSDRPQARPQLPNRI